MAEQKPGVEPGMKSDGKSDDKFNAKSNDKSDDSFNDKSGGRANAKARPSAISNAKTGAGSNAMTNDKFNDKSDAKTDDKNNANADAKTGRTMARDCVLCGCCLEGCPLFAATGREELSPRAKALLAGPSKFTAPGQEGGLDDKAVAELAGLCLACGKCETLCPQGVSIPALIARLRAEHPDFRQWLWKQWITRLAPYWSLAAQGAALVPDAMIGALTPASLGLALKGLRGLRPGKGLRAWLTITKFPVEAYRQQYADRPVAVFDGCVGSGPRKAWADTARHLLQGLGANLADVDFSCCGSTLGVAGLPEDQERARRANVEAWRALGQEGGRPLVVAYCATCYKGLADYVEPEAGAGLFADADEEAAWAAAVTPLSSLLLGATAKAGRGAPAVVGYHRPCHVDPGDADFRLLSGLLGARLRTPAKATGKGGCCGFGGIMQLSAPELSAQVGAACWAGLDAALGFSAAPEVTPAYVLTGCSGCVMQLGATAPKNASVGHWLEIIKQD